jgi:peroxiredoxin
MRLKVKERVAGWRWVAVVGLASATLLSGAAQALGETPEVGARAADFSLSTPEGKPLRLSALTHRGDVVLVVLRGYPGYQCPYCQKQVHDFETHAKAFAERGAEVLLVYPGPQGQLDEHAREFLSKEDALPANFHLVIDPAYKFTNLYGLRWEAADETAYPATFLIDRHGKVYFRKISKEHGGRTTADQVLAEMAKPR